MSDTVCEGPFTLRLSEGLVADGFSCPKRAGKIAEHDGVLRVAQKIVQSDVRVGYLEFMKVYKSTEHVSVPSNPNRLRSVLGL